MLSKTSDDGLTVFWRATKNHPGNLQLSIPFTFFSTTGASTILEGSLTLARFSSS
jgi:hypothetical protein